MKTLNEVIEEISQFPRVENDKFQEIVLLKITLERAGEEKQVIKQVEINSFYLENDLQTSLNRLQSPHCGEDGYKIKRIESLI